MKIIKSMLVMAMILPMLMTPVNLIGNEINQNIIEENHIVKNDISQNGYIKETTINTTIEVPNDTITKRDATIKLKMDGDFDELLSGEITLTNTIDQSKIQIPLQAEDIQELKAGNEVEIITDILSESQTYQVDLEITGVDNHIYTPVIFTTKSPVYENDIEIIEQPCDYNSNWTCRMEISRVDEDGNIFIGAEVFNVDETFLYLNLFTYVDGDRLNLIREMGDITKAEYYGPIDGIGIEGEPTGTLVIGETYEFNLKAYNTALRNLMSVPVTIRGPEETTINTTIEVPNDTIGKTDAIIKLQMDGDLDELLTGKITLTNTADNSEIEISLQAEDIQELKAGNEVEITTNALFANQTYQVDLEITEVDNHSYTPANFTTKSSVEETPPIDEDEKIVEFEVNVTQTTIGYKINIVDEDVEIENLLVTLYEGSNITQIEISSYGTTWIEIASSSNLEDTFTGLDTENKLYKIELTATVDGEDVVLNNEIIKDGEIIEKDNDDGSEKAVYGAITGIPTISILAGLSLAGITTTQVIKKRK